MLYFSTRNKKITFSFKEVFLNALASDGGLYVPTSIPKFSPEKIQSMKNYTFQEVSYEIFNVFVGDAFSPDELKDIISKSYSVFRNKKIVDLKLIDNISCVELFHGPTLAFKDIAMQVLGNMYENLLNKSKNKMNLITATSGDTGAAAIDALKSKKYLNIFVLHPENNVYNIAIKGTFDDCQYLVKEMFNDQKFRNNIQMSGVNSINWARIVAQIVYYFFIYLKQEEAEKKMIVSVPTGNFGDIYAGYIAKQMGLPIEKLIIASNHNNLLEKCLSSGLYQPSNVNPSVSPSMDIQVASNFERILFEICNEDESRVVALMNNLKNKKEFQLNKTELSNLQDSFLAHSVSEEETLQTIKEVYQEHNFVLDPHSAIGFKALKKSGSLSDNFSYFCLETAHACKFPDAIVSAIGKEPPMPDFVKKIFSKEESFIVLDGNLEILKSYIEKKASNNSSG
jgi:threonine synthase